MGWAEIYYCNYWLTCPGVHKGRVVIMRVNRVFGLVWPGLNQAKLQTESEGTSVGWRPGWLRPGCYRQVIQVVRGRQSNIRASKEPGKTKKCESEEVVERWQGDNHGSILCVRQCVQTSSTSSGGQLARTAMAKAKCSFLGHRAFDTAS